MNTVGSRLPRIGLLALVGLTALAWVLVIWSSRNMDAPLVMAMMPMTNAWTTLEASMVWVMWAVMMGAMMLPSVYPVIVMHRRVAASRPGGCPGDTRYFVAAYLIAWAVFSLAATVAQWALQSTGVLSRMLVITQGWLAGVLLVVAGIYQFTPLKDSCLGSCRTPIGFFITHWRTGPLGAFSMGLRHGLYCIGCCWALMALLFVFGVMSLQAIALLATAVAVEKLAPGGTLSSRTLGVIFVAWGLLAIFSNGIQAPFTVKW
jgi:predicted metal-binding membrane protein